MLLSANPVPEKPPFSISSAVWTPRLPVRSSWTERTFRAFPKNSLFLVTGGAGFIGSNFILYWLEHHPQDEIINLDALTYAGNPANLAAVADNPHYHFVHGNICDQSLVDKLTRDVDLIVHFAAESHVDRSILAPEVFLQTNVSGTYNLLEAAKKSDWHNLKV